MTLQARRRGRCRKVLSPLPRMFGGLKTILLQDTTTVKGGKTLSIKWIRVLPNFIAILSIRSVVGEFSCSQDLRTGSELKKKSVVGCLRPPPPPSKCDRRKYIKKSDACASMDDVLISKSIALMSSLLSSSSHLKLLYVWTTGGGGGIASLGANFLSPPWLF